MDALYSRWAERMQAAVAACERLGGNQDDQSLTVAPPATLDKVAALEDALDLKLGLKLPTSFRAVLLNFSARVAMNWFLPTDTDVPAGFESVDAGESRWDIKEILGVAVSGKLVVETSFSNLDKPRNVAWQNKMIFAELMSGDALAFDMDGSADPPVVYLSHDWSGGIHGYRLGNNFADFVERSTLLGCPGYDDSGMTPFLNDPTSGLDPHGENAQKWRQWFGLNV